MEGKQGLALPGRALVVADVGHVLVVEVVERGQHGVRGSLSQSAEGGVLDDLAQVLQRVEVFHRALALGDFVENLVQPLVTHPARRAFPAGFLHREVEVELGHGYHTVVLVHDNHTAGTHHGAGSR